MIGNAAVDFVNLAPSNSTILKEVLAGLSKSQKALPPKLLYDKRGSEIFEKICLLKEYYPTRAETEILKSHAIDICQMIGEDSVLIEPGSGAGDKIRHLLAHMINLKAYVPIEISKDILLRMTEEFHEEFPLLNVIAICADFNRPLNLPLSLEAEQAKKVIFFPGSTIGNFNPQEAIGFLKNMAKTVGIGGGMVIGVDMKKSAEIFKLAYDDPHGVTADFNLNLLQRLNRETAAGFDIRNFSHEAIYNEKLGRVEMHLVSKISQLVRVSETIFRFDEGETIHTESSYKYTVDEFSSLGAKAGWEIKKFWKNKENQFCVYYFEHAH